MQILKLLENKAHPSDQIIAHKLQLKQRKDFCVNF